MAQDVKWLGEESSEQVRQVFWHALHNTPGAPHGEAVVEIERSGCNWIVKEDEAVSER